MQLNREYIYIKNHFEVPKHLELPLAREMAFIRYCVFNVCNFLKCKIGLKGNRTKTLFICSLEKKKLLLHKRINIKPPDRCCSLFSLMPTQFAVVILFILYFVSAIQLKSKTKNSRKWVKKKFETIDKREKEKGKTVLSGTKVKIT